MAEIEEVIVEAEDMEVVDMVEIEEGTGIADLNEVIVPPVPDLAVIEVALAIGTVTVHQATMEEVIMDLQVEAPPMIGNDQEAEVVIVRKVAPHPEGMEVAVMRSEEEVSQKGDDMREDEDHVHQIEIEIVGGIKFLIGARVAAPVPPPRDYGDCSVVQFI